MTTAKQKLEGKKKPITMKHVGRATQQPTMPKINTSKSAKTVKKPQGKKAY